VDPLSLSSKLPERTSQPSLVSDGQRPTTKSR